MIHQYKLNGYNIVLDVYSGSINLVDDVAYDIIQLFCGKENGGVCLNEGHPSETEKKEIIRVILDKYKDNKNESLGEVNEKEITLCMEDIAGLRDGKKLFSEDIFRPEAGELKNRHSDIKALCLHVAHTCNLNCSYCFAAQGNFHGERALMSAEVAKRALDFLVENSGNRVNLEVDFFGGEPLMNWDVVKATVAYGRELEKHHNKRFRFTLTTNGVGINQEVIDFANKEMHNVVLSLDGRPWVHDTFRRTINEEGSYHTVVPKFKELVEARGNKGYYMRGTFTGNNLDFTEDVKHMADLGFDQLSMEPVVCSPDEPYALKDEDLPTLFRQYEILAEEMLKRRKEGRPFEFYHYIIDLVNGPCIYKRISGCGSGTEYFAVTPWGELYPCHQFVGDEEYKMGDIWTGVTNLEASESFKACNVYSRKECDDCWARLYCSGGCAANGYHTSGSIEGVYEYGCKLFRKRMECAIMLEIATGEEISDNAN